MPHRSPAPELSTLRKLPEAERRRRLKLLRDRPKEVPGRRFLIQGAGLTTLGLVLGRSVFSASSRSSYEHAGAPIRPPTADADDAEFQTKCIRCGLCGTVCENGCIRFFDLDEVEHGAFTPFLDVRRRACTLCMRCTQICPSGALVPVEAEPKAILANVRMARAVVDPELCLSYQGRVCGYCHDACPLPGQAIRLQPPALPVVLDACVGCGQCVEGCPQWPTAIRVERLDA